MQTRAMGPGAGYRWLKQGVNLGRTNPKAIFGGAAWMLLVMLVLAFVGVGLSMGLQFALHPGRTASMVIGMLAMLPLMLVFSALMVGYLRLVDAVESGRAAGANDVFGGLDDIGTSLRAFALVLMLALLQDLLLAGLVAGLAPDLGRWYLQAMQAGFAGAQTTATPAALPHGVGLFVVAMMVVGLFCYAVQAIGLGQVALRRRGVFAALGDSVAGAARNLLPLLVFLLVLVVGLIVLALGIFLLGLLLALLGKLVGVWLVLLVVIPSYLLGLVAMLVVMFGAMYHLWRDVCGDAAATDAAVAV